MSSKRVKREQQVRKYLQDEVDPYIRPLLMELMKVRPPNVYEYLQYWVSSPAKEIYEKKQKEKQNEQEESVHYESIKEALVELGNDESEKKESAPVLEEVENQEDEEVKENEEVNEEVNEEIVTKTEEVVEEEETVKESMPEIEKQEDEVVSQKEVVETLNEEKEELKEENEEQVLVKEKNEDVDEVVNDETVENKENQDEKTTVKDENEKETIEKAPEPSSETLKEADPN